MSVSSETKIHIRKARKEDEGAIRALILRSGINPTSLKWKNFLIAESSTKEFLGCGQVKAHSDGSWELASLAVKKDWQRRGIGKKLIAELLETHPQELHLMCQSSLGSLYEQYGFETIAEEEMPTYFRRVSKLAGVLDNLRKEGESLLIMRRASLD